ncbi:MAG: hypothetical protein U0414_32440 [Polyangiaceae bacterium]
MLRSASVLFSIGATLGSALDAIHTHSGATTYPRPIFLKMAWWTPGIFGFAGLSTGLAYAVTERLTGKSITRDVGPAEAAAGFAAFTGLYAITGFLPASNATKLAIVGAGAAGLLAALAPTREAAALAATTAVVGPAVEVFLVSRGAFSHAGKDFLGIPMWLPALYAAGSVAFGVVGKLIAAELDPAPAPAAEPATSAG